MIDFEEALVAIAKEITENKKHKYGTHLVSKRKLSEGEFKVITLLKKSNRVIYKSSYGIPPSSVGSGIAFITSVIQRMQKDVNKYDDIFTKKTKAVLTELTGLPFGKAQAKKKEKEGDLEKVDQQTQQAPTPQETPADPPIPQEQQVPDQPVATASTHGVQTRQDSIDREIGLSKDSDFSGEKEVDFIQNLSEPRGENTLSGDEPQIDSEDDPVSKFFNRKGNYSFNDLVSLERIERKDKERELAKVLAQNTMESTADFFKEEEREKEMWEIIEQMAEMPGAMPAAPAAPAAEPLKTKVKNKEQYTLIIKLENKNNQGFELIIAGRNIENRTMNMNINFESFSPSIDLLGPAESQTADLTQSFNKISKIIELTKAYK